jgi:drug/metabolite transporter (DMT)-like permease
VLFLTIWAGGWPKTVNPLTIVFGVGFGVLFIVTLLFYGMALKTGPLSYTSLLFSAGMVIPVLSGVLVFHDRMSVLQGIGFALILLTFYIVSKQKVSADASTRVNPKWLLFVSLTFLCNGLLGFLSKSHQYLFPGEDKILFLVWGFATAGVCALGMLLFFTVVKKQKIEALRKPAFYGNIAAMGLTNTAGNKLIMDLMSVIPVGVLFPIVNGGVMLVVILMSRVVFGESISRRKAVGITVGLAAIILLSVG